MARPKNEKLHLLEKRKELIFALDYQDYNGQDIGDIFNVNRSVIQRVLKTKPRGWKPKWVKVH